MAATSRSRPIKLVSGTGGGALSRFRSGNGIRGTCWLWLRSAGVEFATSKSLDGCDNGAVIILRRGLLVNEDARSTVHHLSMSRRVIAREAIDRHEKLQ
jgi:hypothetical protein